MFIIGKAFNVRFCIYEYENGMKGHFCCILAHILKDILYKRYILKDQKALRIIEKEKQFNTTVAR